MEALDALAVAEQDILARTTAPRRTRENRACSGDSAFAASASRPSSPPGEMSVGVGDQTFNVETACATYVLLAD